MKCRHLLKSIRTYKLFEAQKYNREGENRLNRAIYKRKNKTGVT